jgi:hypothetical protein|tara:strand:- start:3047 stop:3184 length:138 start_codon:yes stop_codon:yes gene_type:complete
MTQEKAKELFKNMPPHLKQQVININNAMTKIEENDKYNFSKKKDY